MVKISNASGPISFNQNGIDNMKDNWHQSEEDTNKVFGEFTRYGSIYERIGIIKVQKL